MIKKGFTLIKTLLRKNFVSVQGFTLIELLVVISIIGILAAIGLISFSGAQRQARDTERKSDINQYLATLETYANSNLGFYPVYASATSLVTVCQTDLSAESCPEDQVSGQSYLYQSDSSGKRYVIWATFEGSGGYWTGCSNGRVGEVTTTTTDGNCPVADVTAAPTPTSRPPTTTPTPGATATPTSAPTPIPGGNLLADPGFESDGAGWSGIGSGSGISTVEFHSGTKSVEILAPASGAKIVNQQVSISPSTAYSCSGWIKTSGITSSVRINVQWRTGVGQLISNSQCGSLISGTVNWTQISGNITSPATAATADFRLTVGSGSGTAWYDDLVLQ